MRCRWWLWIPAIIKSMGDMDIGQLLFMNMIKLILASMVLIMRSFVVVLRNGRGGRWWIWSIKIIWLMFMVVAFILVILTFEWNGMVLIWVWMMRGMMMVVLVRIIMRGTWWWGRWRRMMLVRSGWGLGEIMSFSGMNVKAWTSSSRTETEKQRLELRQ